MASNLSTLRQPPAQNLMDPIPIRPAPLALPLALLVLILIALPLIYHYQLTSLPAPRALTPVLATLGLLAAGGLGWNCRHYRRLADHHAERAGREREFIELSRQLLGTDDRARTVECIVNGTLKLTSAIGSYLEMTSASGAEVEVVAAAGHQVPYPGCRSPLEGSLTAMSAEARFPIYHPLPLAEAPTMEPPANGQAPEGWLVTAPLLSGTTPIGALILVLPPTHSPAPPVLALERIQIVAEFAALALRRIFLLEEAATRQEALEETLESKARLIRGMTHDLKNPIGAITGYAQILESGIGGELHPAHHEYVGRIRMAADSMDRLLDDLVQLAHAETSTLTLKPEPTDLVALVSDNVEMHRPDAIEKGVRLDCHPRQPIPVLEVDPERVRQVIGNLVSNAVKYTSAPGQITIELGLTGPERELPAPLPPRSPNQWLAIAVADSGPGIEPREHERVFDEFIRLQPEKGTGSGLGLSISRHLARAMGGEITLESDPSDGTTFTLWLPVDESREGQNSDL